VTVRLSVKARQDLIELGRYTAEHWGTDQARTYVTALYSTFESLTTSPNPGLECSTELGQSGAFRMPATSFINC
jgi:toxin ParE1/3/4